MEPPELEATVGDLVDAKEVLRRAAAEGITLALMTDKDGILAGPRERVTSGLREAIREAREELIRELLFREAAEYFQQHSTGPYEDASNPDSEDDTRRREIEDERLNQAWLEADLEGFKEALRSWLKYRLRVLGNSPSRGNCKESDEVLEEHSAGEQPALM